MNIQNALKISGFTHPAELTWLAGQAAKVNAGQNIAEIGCWMGRSTRAMADNTDATIYAIDTWKGSGKEHEKVLANQPENYLLEEFAKNIGEEHLQGPRHHVRPLEDTSLKAADYLGGGCYDLRFAMIFIDGAHDYESVKADILAWQPLLLPGGMLCGHDFDGGRPGVVKAVRELLPNPRMAGAGSIWFAG